MLQSIKEDHLDLILEWRNDLSIRHLMINSHKISKTDHHQWFQKYVMPKKIIGLIYSEKKIHLGVVTFRETDKTILEWGFYTAPVAPSGIGTRMCTQALNFAFDKLGASKIIGRVIEFNDKSKHFHLKLGFQEKSLDLDAYQRDNKKFNIYNYYLEKEHWNQNI